MTTYTFLRGEPVALALEVTQGDATGYTLTSQLKRVTGSGVVPGVSKPAAATFAVVYVAASGNTAARWTLTIDAAASAALTPGWYATDAVVRSAGSVVARTVPVWIEIKDGVTQ